MARWFVYGHAGPPKPTSHGVRIAADISIGLSWEEFHKEDVDGSMVMISRTEGDIIMLQWSI